MPPAPGVTSRPAANRAASLGARPLLAAALLVVLSGCASLPTTGIERTAGGALAYSRSGAGRPAVVLQSGLGDGKRPWASVAAPLADSLTVFAYDRPGYGDSSPTAAARDPCTIATELHDLLGAAGVPPPYLLVGHSLGGLYQYVFARLYPDEVAGVVLLDPTHPTHWQRMQEEAPASATLVGGLRSTVFTAAMRREFDDQAGCLDRFTAAPPLQVPVRLLVRSRFELVESAAFQDMVRRLEVDWQKLTGAARVERVDGAGHYIHRDRPASVVAAVRALAAPSSRPAN